VNGRTVSRFDRKPVDSKAPTVAEIIKARSGGVIRGYPRLLLRLGRARKDLRPSNERKAYAAALRAFADFGRVNGWNSDTQTWLFELATALTDLDFGIVSPLLKPPLKSKSFSSNVWRRFALVALGMKVLGMSGIERGEAASRALRAVKIIRGTERKTVLSRYDDFQRDRIKNREAVRVFKMGLSHLEGKTLSPEVLEVLAKQYFALADLGT
jgi:hypothetical protein